MCPPKNLHLVTLCSCRLLLSTIHKLNTGSHLWNTCNKAQRKSGQYQSLHQVYEFRHPDPAYPITCNILAAFPGVNLTMNRIQQKDKQSQSEHGIELWKYLPEFCLLRFKKNRNFYSSQQESITLSQPLWSIVVLACIDLKEAHVLSWNRQHLQHTCPISKQAGLHILLFYFDYKMLGCF